MLWPRTFLFFSKQWQGHCSAYPLSSIGLGTRCNIVCFLFSSFSFFFSFCFSFFFSFCVFSFLLSSPSSWSRFLVFSLFFLFFSCVLSSSPCCGPLTSSLSCSSIILFTRCRANWILHSDTLLKCGVHKCRSRCHRVDDHSRTECNQLISRVCARQHKVKVRCGRQNEGCVNWYVFMLHASIGNYVTRWKLQLTQ